MSLVTASTELGQGLKVARSIWEDARRGWQDTVAAEFETHDWTPLSDQVVATIEAIDRLTPILARLYQECS
jgi:hypothetical protein